MIMCTKTKTSYGCGHSFKDKTPCGESPCVGVDKYAFLKEGDCQACRSAGDTVTRGRDGQGRHAREIQRSYESGSSSSVRKQRPENLDVSGGRGPWGPVTRSEKVWDSPTRRMADHAWLNEHEDRISDLQEKFDKFSFSSSRSSREQSPRDCYDSPMTSYDEEAEIRSLRSQSKFLPYEIAVIDNNSDHRRWKHRRRHYSHDSDDSMPNCLDSPSLNYNRRRVRTVAPRSEYEHQFSYDEENRRRRYGARTEPGAYTQTIVYDSPVSGSPYTGGYFSEPYEVIQPQRLNFTSPRSYRARDVLY